ncbi:MAG: hypothetical protein HY722_12100, partial [Planctomycetes bacterium]|nr:hypothetical protein [Planctomycetota bacterium]
MPIRVQCACGRVIHVADSMAGKKGRCPGCSEALSVPWQPDVFEFADKICPGCGKIWEVDAKACEVCGTRLDKARPRSGVMSFQPPKVTVRRERPAGAANPSPAGANPTAPAA